MLRSFLELRLSDLVDVTIVAALLWMGIVWLRTTRARQAFIGLGILGGFYLLAQQFELRLTVRLFQGFFAAGVLVLIVVFQDDLRRLFERIAVAGLRRRRPRPGPDVLARVVEAVGQLAAARVGALIVLPGRDPLTRYLEGGVYLRGHVSVPLLRSLFDDHSPGHDGAAVLEGNVISRFAVHLPLSDSDARGAGGTRHAAALGLAERSDALCIVVSEERGTISVARDGRLWVVSGPEALDRVLREFLRAVHPPRDVSGFQALVRNIPARWREGLLALGVTLALWTAFVPGDAVVNVAFSVPVQVENLPEGFKLSGIDPKEVEVTLTGRRRDLYLATPAQVRVRVDALLVQLGRRTFEITPENVEHPESLRVESIDPERVRLQVEGSG